MAAWTEDDVPPASGKVFVVTGANSGIGWEAARMFAAAGGRVILACRDRERGEAALARLGEAVRGADAAVETLDLASLASIEAFAARFAARHGRLDVLVNNAGVMAIPRRLTADGFEMQIGTNHLGHFALTGRLWPLLVAAGASRVVTVSSLVHRRAPMDLDDLMGERAYDPWVAYGRSKLANLLFAHRLARRAEASGLALRSVACHPGYAATNLQHVGPTMTGSTIGRWTMTVGNTLLAQSAAGGALPTVFAALAEEARPGDFVGPRVLGLWGAATRGRSNDASYDLATQDRLWAISEALTGVRYEGS